MDVTKNVVVIEGPQSAIPTDTAAALQRTFGDAVDIRYKEARVEFTAIRSGDAVINDNLGRCSLGWRVDGADARSGEYMMIAGHCMDNLPTASRWRHATGAIGGTDAFVFGRGAGEPGSDWGLIRLNPGVAAEYRNEVFTSERQGSRHTISRVLPPQLLPIGATVFKRGSTTDLTAGRIVAHDVAANVGGKNVTSFTKVQMVVDSGDSGGPVFAEDPSDPGAVIALGVVSASAAGTDPATDDMLFQPLDIALQESGTTLVVDPAPR